MARTETINRRQFLTGVSATAVAAALPAPFPVPQIPATPKLWTLATREEIFADVQAMVKAMVEEACAPPRATFSYREWSAPWDARVLRQAPPFDIVFDIPFSTVPINRILGDPGDRDWAVLDEYAGLPERAAPPSNAV